MPSNLVLSARLANEPSRFVPVGEIEKAAELWLTGGRANDEVCTVCFTTKATRTGACFCGGDE